MKRIPGTRYSFEHTDESDTPRAIVSSIIGEKKTSSARHGRHTARIEPKPQRLLCPGGFPLPTSSWQRLCERCACGDVSEKSTKISQINLCIDMLVMSPQQSRNQIFRPDFEPWTAYNSWGWGSPFGAVVFARDVPYLACLSRLCPMFYILYPGIYMCFSAMVSIPPTIALGLP